MGELAKTTPTMRSVHVPTTEGVRQEVRMPYSKRSELPEAVQRLPEHAQEIYLAAFNSAWEQYGHEEARAHAVAWAAVKRDYKEVNGRWVKKSAIWELLKALVGLGDDDAEPELEPDDMAELMKAIEVPFIAKDDAKRLVYGVVYEPHKLDSQREWATPDEVEKAAHKFMRDYRRQAHRHAGEASGDILPVESYICPQDITLGREAVAKGGWVLVSYVANDDAWEAIQKGDDTGFSMLGRARRRKRALPGGADG